MRLIDLNQYMEDVTSIANCGINWDTLYGKNIVISGGTGMIGSFLCDVVMFRNRHFRQNTTLYVLGRSKKKARERFDYYWEDELFNFVECDINEPISVSLFKEKKADYVIHAASNTHPVAYATDPIGTISTNVIGLNNMLSMASEAECIQFVFLSSVEIYGENKGDIDYFTEDYLGYIDCNTLRAGYPESKRTGEALCQAYRKQKNLKVVIPRLSRVYGPTMLPTDTKAMSQFILKAVAGEDIVLKSQGTQFFSYCYVADAVSAILTLMLEGKDGEAYNVASSESDIMLKDLAQIIAAAAGTDVKLELPDELETQGYSKATKAVLDITKLRQIGWSSGYDMEKGIKKVIDILKRV